MGGHDLVADTAALRSAAAALDVVASSVEQYALGWIGPRVRQRVQSPGSDPVSVRLMENMVTMGERAGLWMVEYARQVRAAQDALLAQAESYERVEREAAERLGRL